MIVSGREWVIRAIRMREGIPVQDIDNAILFFEGGLGPVEACEIIANLLEPVHEHSGDAVILTR